MELLHEAKLNKFSSIANFPADDIERIWVGLCQFIEDQLLLGSAIRVQKLGLITLKKIKLCVGRKDVVFIKPQFILDEKMAKHHQIKYGRPFNQGSLKTVSLNFAQIAHDVCTTRDWVDSVMREVVEAFWRGFSLRNRASFTINNVGGIYLKEQVVRSSFLPSFVELLENGEKMGKQIRNLQIPAPYPSNGDSSAGDGKVDPNPTIPSCSEYSSTNFENFDKTSECVDQVIKSHSRTKFDAERNDGEKISCEIPLKRSRSMDVASVTSSSQTVENNEIDRMIIGGAPSDGGKDGAMETIQENNETVVVNKNNTVRWSSHNLFGLTNKIEPEIENPKNHEVERKTSIEEIRIPEPTKINFPKSNEIKMDNIKERPNFIKNRDIRPINSGGPMFSIYKRIASAQEAAGRCQSPQAHCHDSRELCYLCSQRAAKNIPVYLHKERDAKEKTADRALIVAQQRKAEQAMKRDAEIRERQRNVNIEISDFNVGAAEAIKEKRTDDAMNKLPHQSYVFRNRPFTPHKSVGQSKMATELERQIDGIKSRSAKAEADKRLIERLYQIQLAEGLTRERERYLSEKNIARKKMNETLNYQIKNREPELPKHYSDILIFGKNDTNMEKRRKMRERSRLYSSENFTTSSRRKVDHLSARQNAKNTELEMLKRTKSDLDEDLTSRSHYKKTVRQSLEDNWTKMSKSKFEKEIERKIGIPEKFTVQEQLDQYRRCGQCQKKPGNVGESSVWKESYYTPGSRIMV